MRSFFSLLFTFFSITISQAQDPFRVVDLQNPNISQLEYLTFQSVNELKRDKKQAYLLWDEVLKRAAKDHADYLIKEKKLSHNQNIKEKRTPSDRVRIHGGLIYTVIGENIVEVPLGVNFPVKGIKRSTVTYQAAANTMAQIWKASPGHYKNIIFPGYNYTAIAVAYDASQQRLIAVQVFAFSATPSSKFNLPDYSSQLLNLPKKDLPHKLKSNKYKLKDEIAITRFHKLKIDRGYLTGSYKEAKKTFKGKRSGIAQEFIPLSQFDSNSTQFSSVPNRRNGLYELNGPLSKPVYRRALLKYSRKNTFRDYIIYTSFLKIKKRPTQFIYPLGRNEGQTEFNLFFVKSKRLLDYRSYINIPDKLFDTDFPQLDFKNNFKEVKAEKKFRLYHTFDTLQYKIYYDPGEINLQPDKQEEIKNSLAHKSGKILSVEASAFASIEGEKSANDKLAKERLNQFMQLINPYRDSLLASPKIKTREQWEFFYRQITSTPLQSLKKMNIEKIRIYVNEHSKDSLLATLLNAQRYMMITIVWKNDLKEYLPTKSNFQIYDSLMTRIERTKKPGQDLINALEKTQLALYYELSQKNKDSIIIPIVPYREKYPALQYNNLLFQYSVMKNMDDMDFYNQLHYIVKSPNFPDRLKSQATYNNLVLIYRKLVNNEEGKLLDYSRLNCYKYRQSEFYFRKYKKINCSNRPGKPYPKEYFILKEIPGLIQKGKELKIIDFPEKDLWKYYYLYTIHSLEPFIPIDQEIFTLLPHIKRLYHPVDSVLSEQERLKYAYFYCCFHKYEIAKKLVEPMAIGPDPDKEALMLYIALQYEDFKNEHDYVDMLIKEFPRLGKESWCNLWFNHSYLNFLLLEDIKLKNFYNCNCGR